MKCLKHEDCVCTNGQIIDKTTAQLLNCDECDYNTSDEDLKQEAYWEAYDLWEAQLKGN